MDKIQSKPWCTPLIVKSLKLYIKTYGQFPSCQFDISLTSENIPYVPLLKPTWLSRFAHFYLKCFCCIAAITILNQILLLSSPNSVVSKENIIRLGGLISLHSWLGAMLVLRHNFAKQGCIVAECFNICTESKYLRKRSIKSKSTFQDTAGLLLAYYMLGVLVFGPPLPFLLSYFHLSPTLVILQNFRFNVSSFSSQLLILLQDIWIVEYFGIHDLSVACFLAICNFLATQRHIETLRFYQTKHYLYRDIVLKYYMQITIVYSAYAKYVNDDIFALVIFSQIVLTGFVWLSINCGKLLPMFLICCFSCAFVGGLGLALYIFNLLATARLLSGRLIELGKGGKRVKLFCMVSRRRANFAAKILQKRWIAQKQLPINCGQAFAFSKNAIMNYLNVLSTNLTNAVLLIKV